MITDGLAEGYAVLKIPCGRQPLYESGRGERIAKKGKEEPDVFRRGNRRGTEGNYRVLCVGLNHTSSRRRTVRNLRSSLRDSGES